MTIVGDHVRLVRTCTVLHADQAANKHNFTTVFSSAMQALNVKVGQAGTRVICIIAPLLSGLGCVASSTAIKLMQLAHSRRYLQKHKTYLRRSGRSGGARAGAAGRSPSPSGLASAQTIGTRSLKGADIGMHRGRAS